MRNIIVIDYKLHYSRGSECSVAWNYIKNMSQNNKLIVLYGSSGEHHQIGNTVEMEEWCKKNVFDNVEIIPVKPTFKVEDWNYSLKGISQFYKAYKLWHLDVLRVVNRLITSRKVDIIHFLGPIGYHEPGFLYDLPVPYIWGPVGGIIKVPQKLLLTVDKKTGSRDGLKISAKALISKWRLSTNKEVKKAMRETDVLVCATRGNQKAIEKAIGNKHHSKLFYMAENCLDRMYDLNYLKFESEKINLIFIGRMDVGKALIILLEALNKLGQANKIFHLDVLGDGELKAQMMDYVIKNGLNEVVEFHGNVARNKVFEMLQNAHLMVITSLIEGNPTTIWESMSHAVPTLTLDHCGMHDTIKDGSGIKIPLGSYDEVVNRIIFELQKLAETPSILKDMALQLVKDREEFTWEKRKEIFENLYYTAEQQFRNRKEN